MKRTLLTSAILAATFQSYASPNITIATSTNSRDFPLSADSALVVPLSKSQYTFTVNGLDGTCSATENQRIKFNTPLSLNCNQPTEFSFKIRFAGDYAFQFNSANNTLSLKRQPKKNTKTEFKRPLPNVECSVYTGGSVTIQLGETFEEGTELRNTFTGEIVKVNNKSVTLTPGKHSNGLVLLEEVEVKKSDVIFNWRNASIYFVMVDRFNNGDTTNDLSYGRKKDGKDEVGTFHGGDLKGVVEKLDYIQSLGMDAIWLSPIVEQVHGFVGGGDKGSFPFYAYHGYWTRDFTKIDENFGNDEDLALLVKEAHKRGIKILLDAVLNHTGYATLADLQFDQINAVNPPSDWPKQWRNWQPKGEQNWHSFHEAINYQSPEWKSWWGQDWVRTGLPGYDKPGTSDITMSLAGLPDLKTESDQFVTPPQWLLDNPGTRVVKKDSYTVTNYLVEWQTDWVKKFGIDGFRVDTVKHVESDVWKRLKQQATTELGRWQKENDKPNTPFWMMGEVWGHNAYRSPYFDDGFDALINFDMQKKMDKGAVCFSQMESTYSDYSSTLADEPDFNPVSYMSSHDTELFFGRFKSIEMQKGAANALLLSPGAIQIYYGDEVARKPGPYADDFHQSTRSDMNWKLDTKRIELLTHWKTIGKFRQSHPSIGAGSHNMIKQSQGYGFSRILSNDKVFVYYAGKSIN
ncbi:alpha-amylase [Vibrio tapetis]|uniref:Alpha-amylase n=1 Tax=Vibrio tapetis subsp. tapetis TaxID=1671868 RepID=A0A2N8ZLW4_9VIBR|nr:alpha-amylase [Vibrio tapetis]SON52882.1 Alpha-amylase [Vibrio tapetis subsp. tapetis]